MSSIKSLWAIFLIVLIPEIAVAELLKDQHLTSSNKPRTYDVYLPESNTGQTRPLVILLHGHMGDADVMTGENNRTAPYKVWLSIAERESWFVVIPDGEYGSNNHRGWNDCRADTKTNPQTDDVKFLSELMDFMIANYPVDKNRLYAHGTSNGGNMAYRLALESGDRLRAIAAIAASMPEKNKCKSTNHPVSVLIINGTNDPILPYKGGRIGKRKAHKRQRGSALSTAETVGFWLNNNGITSKPFEKTLADVNKRDGSTVHIKQFKGGKNNTEVVLYEVRGGGHTEPSLTEHYRRVYTFITGKQNKDFEMAHEVWSFFEQHQ